MKRESLDYDTWLQQRAALTDDEAVCVCGDYFNVHTDEGCSCCACGAFREPDDNVPDEADTDPDYD